jgi:hypothetical protein
MRNNDNVKCMEQNAQFTSPIFMLTSPLRDTICYDKHALMVKSDRYNEYTYKFKVSLQSSGYKH